MNQDCNQECNSCAEDCADRQEEMDFSAHLNEFSSVDKVIGVISGKGGVGKSLVTSMLAVAMNRLGKKTAILDADVTGPSIPKAFGIKENATSNGQWVIPVSSKGGIDIMSTNLLLANETDPVVWRGPIIGSTVKSFWTDVVWLDIDYMFIDMPPGTGDVSLTVFQSLPIDGIIVVTSPQELVSMIVSKAVKMAEIMHIPILGLVENMSYFQCSNCGMKHKIFGDSHIDKIAQSHNLEVLAKLPLDPKIAEATDKGQIESLENNYMADLASKLLQMEDK